MRPPRAFGGTEAGKMHAFWFSAQNNATHNLLPAMHLLLSFRMENKGKEDLLVSGLAPPHPLRQRGPLQLRGPISPERLQGIS